MKGIDMKIKFYMVVMVTLVSISLIGCSKTPPKCSDDSTIKLVRQIILNQTGVSEGLSEKEIQESMKIEYPRASAFNKEIKKYSCEAKLIVGDKYQLPINYESQLDDKNQHIVSVGGISFGDLMIVSEGIKQSVKKSRESTQAQTSSTNDSVTVSTLPFVGTRRFNFTTGNGTVDEITIEKDGTTTIVGLGTTPQIEYKGKFSNPIKLNDGEIYLFKSDKVSSVKENGEILKNCDKFVDREIKSDQLCEVEYE